MTATRLHVMHASLKFNLERHQKRRALETIYDRGADVIGHTEAAGDGRLIRAVAEAYGYDVVQPWRDKGRRSSTAVLVRNDRPDLELVDGYYVATTPGQPGLARLGGHEPRGLAIAELAVAGSTMFVAEFHTVTGWGQPGRAPGRDETILEQWETSTKVAARLGRGSDLSLLMGDVNYDPDDRSPEDPSRILARHGWTSALEEAGKPDLPTHGRRTIDQLYTLDSDRRVSVAKVRRWTAPPLDHAQVSVWLDVTARRKAGK